MMHRHYGTLLAVCSLYAAAAPAMTISVSTADMTVADDGSCSLPEAITAANNDMPSGMMAGECNAGSGADVIELAGIVYTLTSVNSNAGHGPNGLPVIASQITIEGNDSVILRDPGAPLFRILSVSPVGKLTLNLLSLQGGHAADGGGVADGFDGGCLYSEGELHLIHSQVSLCSAGDATAPGIGGRGGAIFAKGGVLTLSTSSTVDQSQAGSADTYGGAGGGIYADSATVEITDSTVSGNTAGHGDLEAGIGGGLYVMNSQVSLLRSLIDGNAAGSTDGCCGGSGGGVYSYSSTLLLDSSGVVSNTTGAGRSGGSGGGLFVYGGSLAATSSAINSNQTEHGRDYGMAGGGGGGGAGAFLQATSVSLIGCLISFNTGGRGGFGSGLGDPGGPGGGASALSVESSTPVAITGCVIEGNSSGDGGDAGENGHGGNGGVGALSLATSSVNILETTIQNNRAGRGGDAEVSGTGGEGGNAGGLYNSADLTMKRCLFKGNVAGGGGAAENPGDGGSGGAIFSEGSSLALANISFMSNDAGFGGSTLGSGAVGGTGGSGGALATGSVSQVANVTMYGNRAGDGGPGSMQYGASGTGGGLWSFLNTTVVNTILASNTYGDCATDGGLLTDGGHNIVADGTCGLGTAVDPLLAPDYSYSGGSAESFAPCVGVGDPDPGCSGASPAIDAGDGATCTANLVDNVDQRGASRSSDGQCDIGAVESGGTAGLFLSEDQAARPGGIACIPVRSRKGITQTTLANRIHFEFGTMLPNGATINPAIGPLTLSNKQVAASYNTAIPAEVLTVFGGVNPIPFGMVYTAYFKVDPMASLGVFELEDPNGRKLHVTTCTGDCSGDGSVSLGDVQRCVNHLLGQPVCNLVTGSNCPIADVNNDNEVSIGELQQCVNSFLGDCS